MLLVRVFILFSDSSELLQFQTENHFILKYKCLSENSDAFTTFCRDQKEHVAVLTLLDIRPGDKT